MKKQIFVYFLFVTVCLFYLYVPDVVFGQASSVFQSYQETFKRSNVYAHFPPVLNAFKAPKNQGFQNPILISRFVDDPKYIRNLYKDTDDSILILLLLDDKFQALFRDARFHRTVQSHNEINALVQLIQTIPKEDLIKEGEDCPVPPPPPRAITLSIVSGGNQSGEVDKPLAHPFVVEVKGENGSLGGVDVTFSVTGDGGNLWGANSQTITTNEDGTAGITLTLGPDQGIYSVIASVAAKDSLDGSELMAPFTATATDIGPPRPTELTISSGNNQTGEAGKPLAHPFVVKVEGENGSLGGVDVTFNVTGGGGNLWGKGSQTISTNEKGKAGITLTLGPKRGINRVTATVVVDDTTLTQTFIAAATIAAATPSLPIVYWIEDGAILKFNGGKRETLVKTFNGLDCHKSCGGYGEK